MEKLISPADKVKALAGCVSSLFGFVAVTLSLIAQLPSLLNEYQLVWWGFLGVLLLLGLGLLWSALLAPKSRLLQPERFVIRPEERRHLKGREEEIFELSDLCERQLLVFLEGESGAGKTSLVRSGLVDECRRRRRLHPVYLDLSGADWEDHLPAMLWGEVRLSLSDADREILELPPASPGGTLLFSCSRRLAARPDASPHLRPVR